MQGEAQLMYSLRAMVAAWQAQGATHQQVHAELDARILMCGREVFGLFLKQPNAFRVTKFIYLALKYTYTVLATRKLIIPWQQADFAAAEQEYKQWQLAFAGARKSELVQCVLVLEFFAAIQASGKPVTIEL